MKDVTLCCSAVSGLRALSPSRSAARTQPRRTPLQSLSPTLGTLAQGSPRPDVTGFQPHLQIPRACRGLCVRGDTACSEGAGLGRCLHVDQSGGLTASSGASTLGLRSAPPLGPIVSPLVRWNGNFLPVCLNQDDTSRLGNHAECLWWGLSLGRLAKALRMRTSRRQPGPPARTLPNLSPRRPSGGCTRGPVLREQGEDMEVPRYHVDVRHASCSQKQQPCGPDFRAKNPGSAACEHLRAAHRDGVGSCGVWV